jgi:hypothetical protein
VVAGVLLLVTLLWEWHVGLETRRLDRHQIGWADVCMASCWCSVAEPHCSRSTAAWYVRSAVPKFHAKNVLCSWSLSYFDVCMCSMRVWAAWPVGVVPVPVPAAVLPHDTRLFLWSQDGLQPLPPAMDTVDSPEASMPPEPSVPAPPSPPPSLPMPAHRDAAHAENYIGRTQFDVPWSEVSDSCTEMVGIFPKL